MTAIFLEVPVPAGLFARLESEARRRGIAVEEYAGRLLTEELAIEHLIGPDVEGFVADFLDTLRARAREGCNVGFENGGDLCGTRTVVRGGGANGGG